MLLCLNWIVASCDCESAPLGLEFAAQNKTDDALGSLHLGCQIRSCSSLISCLAGNWENPKENVVRGSVAAYLTGASAFLHSCALAGLLPMFVRAPVCCGTCLELRLSKLTGQFLSERSTQTCNSQELLNKTDQFFECDVRMSSCEFDAPSRTRSGFEPSARDNFSPMILGTWCEVVQLGRSYA
jgi:hypothetical protein